MLIMDMHIGWLRTSNMFKIAQFVVLNHQSVINLALLSEEINSRLPNVDETVLKM